MNSIAPVGEGVAVIMHKLSAGDGIIVSFV